MSDIKKRVISAIESLPDESDYNDIMEVVYVQQKIAIGLQQAKEGKVISHEEFIQRVKERQANRQKQ